MTVTNNMSGKPKALRTLDRRLSVAPMMDWTDRHCRFFHRLLAPRTLLYTEMVPTGALLFGDRQRLLRSDPSEHPVALQLGGADPDELARAAALGAAAGYDEINLNVGCPSDRVQQARFGACLMAEPDLVARCVSRMQGAVDVPVTVKTRIGIDRSDEPGFLQRLVEPVARAGCRTFVIHARKAWLSGLSPKENREVPPLRYELVYRLKERFPELQIILNGGIRTPAQALEHLAHVDGVMIGRAAYQDPWSLIAFESAVLGGSSAIRTREQAVLRLLPYVERETADGVPLGSITRHILGLFNGQRGARAWRRHLSERTRRPGAGAEVVHEALAEVAARGLERAA